MKSQEVRIIGGKWRGRKLRFGNNPEIRPTLSRTRETLFNWLRPHIHGARCLDLYAGSGALGFEALSQGAAYTTFVDANRSVCTDLCKFQAAVQAAEQSEVICTDALEFAKRLGARFDIAFVDPPFDQSSLLLATLQALQTTAMVSELVYLEAADASQLASVAQQVGWSLLKTTKAGDTHSALMRVAASEGDS